MKREWNRKSTGDSSVGIALCRSFSEAGLREFKSIGGNSGKISIPWDLDIKKTLIALRSESFSAKFGLRRGKLPMGSEITCGAKLGFAQLYSRI